MTRLFVTLALLFCLAAPVAEANPRIKDIADVEGVRDNQLVGYGLVVGLDGSAEAASKAPSRRRSRQPWPRRGI